MQYAASGEYDKSISHALEAGDNACMAQLIIKSYQQMPASEHPETLLHWMDALPQEIVQAHPQLLIIRASSFLRRGEYYQALPLLDCASMLQNAPQSVIDPIDLPQINAEIMILRSKALFQLGKYQDAQVICQQILEATPMDEVAMRAEAHARFGICANLSGDLSSGIEHLQKALQLWGRHSIKLQVADAHSALSITYSLMGNFALAEHHISRAINCCDQLHDEKGKINNLTRMGNLKQNQGASSEAEAILLQALNITRAATINFEREEAYVLDSLGSIYQDQGRYDQSLQVIEQALELARKVRDNYSINCSLCSLAMTYLLMNDASTALLLLSETNLPTSTGKRISFERALHDLTYGTILLHQNRYDEAYARFTELDTSLETAGLKRELLLVKLYVAACLLAKKEKAEVLNYLEEVTAILEHQGSYKQLILTRLSRLPNLHLFIKTQPALKSLRAALNIKEPIKEAREAAQPSPLPEGASALEHSTQPQLKVQAFGEPAVFLDGQPVTRWRMARSMELFFFLLDCGRPMRKEQIITALWPQVDDQTNQTFHSTIYYLRKALNDSYIASRGGIYSLDLTSLKSNNMEYDVALFKEHQAKAWQLLADENDGEAKEALLAMVQLYQGDYVQPFYGDWCAFRRDELRRIYLEARNHLAHIAWRQEELDESAVHWQHMLAVDNCLEEAHYGLIKYYSRKGNRGLALRQYQRCAETLQQELTTRPGPAIQNLYQRLIGTSESVKKNVRNSSRPGEVSHRG
jgi:DNA-binding SARP family transcriptional activator/Flp pilus assembly protein TadD